MDAVQTANGLLREASVSGGPTSVICKAQAISRVQSGCVWCMESFLSFTFVRLITTETTDPPEAVAALRAIGFDTD